MDDQSLPLDPDIDVDDTITPPPRPVHVRVDCLALVFVGGTLGTLTRYLLSLAIPSWGGLPVATFVINVSGAFLLGWLLESLTRRGPDHGLRRALRLLLGTGFLGGYTTYSAFAVDADGLIASADVAGAALYALATVVVGAAATFGGIALGLFLPRRPRQSRRRGSQA
ncbi:MAG: CrcB family protein [Microbacterium sp.]|uniref:fluoride efflux transporter FluC n=1 Tax=Microbacterium sp. TaxID=51671 RepID=UPI0039E44E27